MKWRSSATTSSRVGVLSTTPAISPTAQGFPCAMRPTMTAAQPVSARTDSARPRFVMSPT